jgi:hypothetical protein
MYRFTREGAANPKYQIAQPQAFLDGLNNFSLQHAVDDVYAVPTWDGQKDLRFQTDVSRSILGWMREHDADDFGVGEFFDDTAEDAYVVLAMDATSRIIRARATADTLEVTRLSHAVELGAVLARCGHIAAELIMPQSSDRDIKQQVSHITDYVQCIKHRGTVTVFDAFAQELILQGSRLSRG